MIQNAARYLAQYWTRIGVVDKMDEEIYEYGLELALSASLNLLCTVLISEYFKLPFTWLFFLLAFIPLRTSAGGYHAKTHWGCILSFSSVYLIALLLVTYIPGIVNPVMNIGMALCSGLVVFVLSPVEASSKALTEHERRRGRIKSLILITLFAVPALFSFHIEFLQSLYVTAFYLGEATAALSLILAKLLNRAS